MNFTLLEKIGATLLLVLALLGAEQAYEHHIYNKGVAAEKSRRDAIDAKIKATADREMARLEALLTAARVELAQAKKDLEQKRKDYENAKTENAGLQSDLAAGRRRLLVAVRAGSCQAAHADGAGPGQVDNGASVTGRT